MFVNAVSLVDFRNYQQVDLPLDPGVTTLVGANGQGKTNLIEAVGYAATLGSHRVSADLPLIRAGAQRALLRIGVVRAGRTSNVELEITAGKANRARVNGGSPVRPRQILGLIRTVLFAPEDLALVKGDPDGRRRLLDDLLVQQIPRVAGTISDLERVLRQRSALLKTAGAALRSRGRAADLSTLDVWDARAAELGAEIIVARQQLVAALRGPVAKAYEEVSGGQGAASVRYRSTVDEAVDYQQGDQLSSRAQVQERYLQAMANVRSKEIERGVSLVGPHRDDLLLTLGELPAKGYASHGESWSFALALRLASWQLLTTASGDWGADAEPVLLLDDVFAELDAQRRERLAQMVCTARQVLVTAAVAEDVPEALSGGLVSINAGEVNRVR